MGESADGLGFLVRLWPRVLMHRADPLSNLKVEFKTKEDAMNYCEKSGV